MTDRRSRHVRRTVPWVLLIFAAGAFVGSRLGGGASAPLPAPAPHAAMLPYGVVAATDVAPDPWSAFDLVPSAPPTAPACDETAQMMAAMFGALANQALDNAGKDPSTLSSAVANDRQAFTSYLEALGISHDDPQVEAMLRAAFPISSALPEIAPNC